MGIYGMCAWKWRCLWPSSVSSQFVCVLLDVVGGDGDLRIWEALLLYKFFALCHDPDGWEEATESAPRRAFNAQVRVIYNRIHGSAG